ncbi:hypothetical protein QZH41_019956, partial [Actinostola sp. cb2023]
RQVKHKKSETTRMTAEMPQQLAIGLAVHQAVCSKELISLLHGFGMSVDYNRVLRVESQIESNVLQRMEQNDSVYLPPDIVKGRHVFFVIDNVDFAEDTPDGGLIGIMLNPNARSKYFLIAPELARLAEKAKEMSGMSACKTEKHHHSLSTAVRARQEKNIEQLATSFRNFTNPFLDESSDLFNIATKVVMPDKVKEDLCQQSAVGTQLLSRFIEERVTTGTYSIWYPMKKRKLNTWKSATKVIRVKAKDKVIELKEDCSLFARMSLVAKSRPEIDIKEAVGEFEFNVVPKSMFAPDGSMLHCSCKSALMAILEKLDGTRTGSNTEEHEIPPPERTATRMKVSLVDGMAEVQALDKPSWVKNCLQLAEHFSTRIFAKKVLEKGQESGKNVVVAWGTRCQATHRDMAHLESSHEEADTKLLLHAVVATSSGATCFEMVSPDTDIFVLSLRRYSQLCEDTSFVTGKGERYRKIKLGPIVRALGPAKTAVLPGFHAWIGADITGSFAGKAKILRWKTFINADQDSFTALADLGTTVQPNGSTYAGIEKLVCKLYQPNTHITKVKELRWLLFRKKQAESERLPPTLAALKESIKRAHHQCMVWNNDIMPNPELPSPSNYGWKLETEDEPCNNAIEEEEEMGSESSDDEEEVDVDDDDEDDSTLNLADYMYVYGRFYGIFF